MFDVNTVLTSNIYVSVGIISIVLRMEFQLKISFISYRKVI